MESKYNSLEERTGSKKGLSAWAQSYVLTLGSKELWVSSEVEIYFPPVGGTQETNLLSY